MPSSVRSFVVGFGLLAATLLTVLLPADAQTCNTNDTGAPPCFANVPDVLNGQTRLLQNDDLVVNTNSFSLETQAVHPAGGNLQTSNSTISNQIPTSITNPAVEVVSNQITIRGRLWSVSHDQVVSASVNVNPNGGQALVASLEQEDSSIGIPSLPAFSNSRNLSGVSADFLGNGYDQMVMVGFQPGSTGQLVLQALGAADPMVEGDGVAAGTPLPIGTNATVFAITAGTFVQPAGSSPTRPAAELAVLSATPGTGLAVTFYSINSALTITQIGSPLPLTLPSGDSTTLSTIAIAAGRFTGGNHDQLTIAFPSIPQQSSSGVAEITTVDFSATGIPTQMTTTSTGFTITTGTPSSGYNAGLYLAKGAFNWAGSSDELGVSVGTDGQNHADIGVMSFNSSLVGTMGSALESSGACHFGLAAGNFDSGGFNLQLADTETTCAIGAFNANIYNVDPNTFAVTLESATSIAGLIDSASSLPLGAGNLAVSLIAGDEEGRSLLLGAPEKLTVAGHFQPDLILEVPPMHVDWVVPDGGSAVGVTNISVFPPTFNASYKFSDSSSTSVSRQTKTSYTFATKENASEKASYGVPGVGSVSVMATQAATQMHQKTVSKNFDTNSGLSVGFEAQTVFDDIVLATESQMNVYSYPVIGMCDTGASSGGSCPNGGDPLYVQFSGPDNVEYTQAGELGANEENYQPVHEPGNIFSYPGSSALLQQEIENGGVNYQPQTETGATWDPQANTSSTITWSSGSSQGSTTGSTANHSFSSSVSASGSVSFDGFGASASAGFDYNDSKSVSTLNQSVNSLSSSTGVTVNYGVSSSSANADYDYQGGTLIYGQVNPNVVQSDLAPPTTIQANGYLVAAHVADMLSLSLPASGSWWKSTYSLPDIALNHPARWVTKAPGGTLNSQTVWENCPYGYQANYTATSCAAYTPDPTTDPPTVGLGQGSFYMMKGLFITPGGTYNGPQVSSVQQGDSLNLRARVYNYSVTNFPSNSQLVVEFYAQQWDGTNGSFLANSTAPQGFQPAAYLGVGTTLGGGTPTPPPAFCGGTTEDSDPCKDSSAPANYEDVYMTWNTGSNSAFAANTYWRVWVVVWAVDNNGNLIQEMAGHGLSAPPSASGPFQNPYQVSVELYSNNLGIYNQTIAIVPPVSSVVASASSPAFARVVKKLRLGTVTTRGGGPILRGVPTTIVAPHIASGDRIDSIFTEYFDGDPTKRGTLFDTQHLPHVFPGAQYVDAARFVPQTCGAHEIYVKAIPTDGSAKTATTKATFKVTDDPIASIDSMIAYVRAPTFPPRFREVLIVYLKAAKRSFADQRTRAGAVQIKVLLDLLDHGEMFFPPKVQKALVDQLTDLVGCL